MNEDDLELKFIKELVQDWLQIAYAVNKKYGFDNYTCFRMTTFSLCVFITELTVKFFDEDNNDSISSFIDDICEKSKQMCADRKKEVN